MRKPMLASGPTEVRIESFTDAILDSLRLGNGTGVTK